MEQGRRRGSGALGWLLFALIILAPRIAGPLANWLSQATGLAISPGAIVAGLIGLYVVATLAGPAVRAAGRARTPGDTRLPTPAQPPGPTAPPPSLSRRPPAPGAGPSLRLPDGPAPLPGPPRFEPIINPRVLTFGIVGLLGLGAFLLVLFFLAGSTP